MSIKVMTAVWEHSQHKGSALLLLLAIADHAHDDGHGAFPSVHSLADKIRMSERQVQRILQILEASQELGIEWGEGPRGTNLYTVRLRRLSPRQFDTPDKMTPPTKATEKGDKTSGRGDTVTSPKPSSNHQEPSEDRLKHITRALGAPRIGRR